jgi:hypothetical protein
VKRFRSRWINRPLSWILLVFITCALSLSAAAQANDYYVSSTGNDSNNGTNASPWATIQKCINSFTSGPSGAVCHVADGTYSTGINVSRGGSSQTARLVIQCDNGAASADAAKGHCKISRGSGITFLFNGANNVDVRGFDIGNNPDMMTAFDGLACGSSGPSSCSNSLHILGNYIHDLGQNVSLTNGCATLGAASGVILPMNKHNRSTTDIQVIGNIILRWGYPPTANCNEMHAIYVDVGTGARVENNLVVSAPGFGIQVYGQDCNAVVSNNTVITARWGITVSGGGEGVCTSGHNTINNNIIMNTISEKFWGAIGCDDSHPNFIGNNITDGVGGDFDRTPLSCSTLTSNPLTHAIGSSIFVNYKTDGTGDYHIKAGSAADGHGTTTCAPGGVTPCVPSLDISALTRPRTPSVGAHELESNSADVLSAPTGLTATVQ